ncbi:hypothetical protein [uncultured Xylophilus sp.]|uniref:hypothetical protein n=1 Tax=uncultured Xylophilus sp. TaxID=296832 RepID=UPI0025CC50DA|nr:hypothetical protein [uncultured Xylophilus sp.]
MVLDAAPDVLGRAAPTSASAPAVVPMYTPLWYATRVLRTTANDWWEGGVPPSRSRHQRATHAVASMAAHFARRLHAARPAVQATAAREASAAETAHD